MKYINWGIDKNKTEFRDKFLSSSSLNLISFNKEKALNEQTEILSFLQSEKTPQLKKEKISYIDKLIMEQEAYEEEVKSRKLIEELKSQLVIELKYFSLNDLEMTNAETLAFKIEKKYSLHLLGELLQYIYVQYNDYHNILAGICRILIHYELDEVMPWGPSILVGLLSHKSETVKEYAVSVVENWANVELLPILRNLDCSSLWLKEYVNDVVKYLEECYVLRKEII